MSRRSPRADPNRVARLVRAAQDGDRIACGDLLDVLTPYVRGLCGPIALEEAGDASQEALIVVLRNIRQLRDPAALYGWVRAITVREAVRVARRRPITAELIEIPAPADPQLAVDLRDVLERLSPEHRAVLLLREVEGLDERQTASLLAIPAGTVKSRLSRARLSFRKEWQR